MRLLLAEDEHSLARALVAILEKNNHTVDAVDNGADALAWLQAGEYDAAVLDIMMPQMDGLTVLQRLRAGGDRTPVLLLTARTEIDDRVLGLDSGANDYLTKPFDSRELLARLRAMTRGDAAADSRLRVGNAVLDRASYELSAPGGSVRLTNREFRIMEILMSNPRQLVSTERLLEKVWGYDTDAEPSVVWVYLSCLRKKLAALQANIRIRAARNAGYCLEERP